MAGVGMSDGLIVAGLTGVKYPPEGVVEGPELTGGGDETGVSPTLAMLKRQLNKRQRVIKPP